MNALPYLHGRSAIAYMIEQRKEYDAALGISDGLAKQAAAELADKETVIEQLQNGLHIRDIQLTQALSANNEVAKLNADLQGRLSAAEAYLRQALGDKNCPNCLETLPYHALGCELAEFAEAMQYRDEAEA